MGFFRQFFMLLDKAIFGLLDDAYNLIYSLSGVFVNNDIAKKIITNLYVVVGIFAFFKIALLLINSIINPEKLNEKGHGLSNILIRTVIMLVLLLFTPMLFQMGYDLQAKIVGWKVDDDGNLTGERDTQNGNIIEKLILGESAATASSGDDMTPGEKFGSIALSALVTVNDNYVDKFIATGDEVGYESSGVCKTQECEVAINEWNRMYANGKMDIDVLSRYINTAEKIDVQVEGASTKTSEKVYVYDYTIVLSTFVAGFIVYVLFSFALDIAARVFQLATLEIVSPLFIVTFIDPKSSSGGTFNKWLKEVGSTYASLFIRLACISLLLLFTSILNSLTWVENGDGYRWTKLTLLLGALLFAKKAPKWISELIGLKSDGLGGLGIGKKLAGAALIGGGIEKGLGAIKKGVGKKAKRVGAGVANRIGADIGGTLAGIKSAKQNALGDKSIASKRQAILEGGGTKAQANMAAVKSFFSREDRKDRREALNDAINKGDLDLKKAGKEARMDARVNATISALDGKLATAGSLYSSARQKFDPNYKTHDQRLISDAKSRYYANSGAFNMTEINEQKDLAEKAKFATEVTGVRCVVNAEGKIVDTNGNKVVFNAKTLKEEYGTAVTSWEDMAAKQKNDKAFIISDNVKDKDGNVTVEKGSAVVKDSDGKYTVVATAEEVKNGAKQIKDTYTSYGQTEMEAVFAERKLDNANQYIQTQQLANQTAQNIARLELDLTPLTSEISKIKSAGEEMVSKLSSLKEQLKKAENEGNLKESSLLREQIETTEKAIASNKDDYKAADERLVSTQTYIGEQKEMLKQINSESEKYYNPDSPIKLGGDTLNMANSNEFIRILDLEKNKARKKADAAKTQAGSGSKDDNN